MGNKHSAMNDEQWVISEFWLKPMDFLLIVKRANAQFYWIYKISESLFFVSVSVSVSVCHPFFVMDILLYHYYSY